MSGGAAAKARLPVIVQALGWVSLLAPIDVAYWIAGHKKYREQ